ncbi:MAG: hypothetical protein IKM79_03275 [Bacteroidales bacterium]|nr:hypothetical protein [Bacteroidales bacterium]
MPKIDKIQGNNSSKIDKIQGKKSRAEVFLQAICLGFVKNKVIIRLGFVKKASLFRLGFVKKLYFCISKTAREDLSVDDRVSGIFAIIDYKPEFDFK